MMNSGDIEALRSELGAVEQRVYDRYAVSRRDARLAVDYLSCFLAAKSRNPYAEIILPQMADWAWHELILDTAFYRQLCARLYGSFLNHAFKPIPPAETSLEHRLRQTFARSLEMFNREYGLGTGDKSEEWREAGWDLPRYRLRRGTSSNQTKPFVPILGAQNLLAGSLAEWLPERLSRRFGITQQTALEAICEYTSRFLTLRPNSSLRPNECSALAHIAWQEHILWTQRYSDDCDRYLGRFLDHDVPSLIGLSAAAA